MTIADFEYLCRATFTSTKTWKVHLATLLGVDITTVSRWCSGVLPIPRWVAVCVWALWTARMRGAFPVPEPDASWDQYAWMEGAELPPVHRRSTAGPPPGDRRGERGMREILRVPAAEFRGPPG